MTRSLVPRLILTDWYLNRVTLTIIAAVGTLSIGALYLRHGMTSVMAMSAAFIATIFLGILIPMETVVQDRKRQTLAFVMSLPISPMEYTAAKMLGNLSAFFAIWVPLVIGMLGTVALAGYSGAIPVGIVVVLAPCVAFSLLLAVAIVTESEKISVTVMAACNVSYSFVWLLLIRVPGIRQEIAGPVPVWSPHMLSIIAGELTVIALAIGLTFYFQSKKTNFV